MRVGFISRSAPGRTTTPFGVLQRAANVLHGDGSELSPHGSSGAPTRVGRASPPPLWRTRRVGCCISEDGTDDSARALYVRFRGTQQKGQPRDRSGPGPRTDDRRRRLLDSSTSTTERRQDRRPRRIYRTSWARRAGRRQSRPRRATATLGRGLRASATGRGSFGAGIGHPRAHPGVCFGRDFCPDGSSAGAQPSAPPEGGAGSCDRLESLGRRVGRRPPRGLRAQWWAPSVAIRRARGVPGA